VRRRFSPLPSLCYTPETSNLPWAAISAICMQMSPLQHKLSRAAADCKLCLSPDDGYQQIAFEYVWRTGGLASEVDYPYIGVSSYCNASKPLTKFNKVCRHRWRGHIWTHGRDMMQIHD